MFWKKIRFFFRLSIAFLLKQYKTILLGTILGVVFFIVFPRILENFPKPKKLLKIGKIGQYTVSDLPDEILEQISYGLTSINEKGEPIPKIVDKWEVLENGKIYSFKFGIDKFVWQNNQKFDPSDINYNFKDVEFTIENDKAIFKLKEPFAPFPSLVSKPLFKKGLIGLGDYKVSKIVKKGKYIKNLFLISHYDKSLDNIVYKFYSTQEDLITGFNLGEIDIIENLSQTNGINLTKNYKVEKKIFKNIYVALFFDCSNPNFSEKTIRQALSYLINKPAGNERVISPLNTSSWAYSKDVKTYIQDIDHAKKMFETQKIEKLGTIKISVLPQFQDIANQVKNDWQQAGIQSEIEVVNYIPENFEVLIASRKIPDDPDQYYYWHSTQAGNITNFKNPRIDKLLEDGRKIIKVEERKNIYFDFQRFLIEESPAVFLFNPTFYKVTR